MDIWLPLLGGAAVGAVITSLFGFIKVSLDRSTEHTQWLRDRKIEAYTDLLRQAHVAIREVHAARRDQPAPANKLDDIKDVTNARLTIVGSQDVRSKATVHYHNLQHAFGLPTREEYDGFRRTLGTSETRLEEAIREDLDVIEKQAMRHSVRVWFFEHLVYPWRDPIDRRYYKKHGHARVHRKLFRR